MPFTESKSIIDALKRELGLNEKMFAVLKIWEKELGPLAKNCEIAKIKKDEIFVEVASNAHLQELTMRRKELIRKINQHFGSEKVLRNIKIQLKQGKQIT